MRVAVQLGGLKPADLRVEFIARRVLPETSGILDLIGKYDPSSLDEPIMDQVRDELYFLLGRHFYNHAEFDKAIASFQQRERRFGRTSEQLVEKNDA